MTQHVAVYADYIRPVFEPAADAPARLDPGETPDAACIIHGALLTSTCRTRGTFPCSAPWQVQITTCCQSESASGVTVQKEETAPSSIISNVGGAGSFVQVIAGVALFIRLATA